MDRGVGIRGVSLVLRKTCDEGVAAFLEQFFFPSCQCPLEDLQRHIGYFIFGVIGANADERWQTDLVSQFDQG